jgi:hypothetical protein
MLVYLSQGEQGVAAGKSVAVGSLVIRVAQVELQNGLHGYTDGVFLACESKNILSPGLAGAMPSSFRFRGRYSVRNSHQFFVPKTARGRLILAGCLAATKPMPAFLSA